MGPEKQQKKKVFLVVARSHIHAAVLHPDGRQRMTTGATRPHDDFIGGQFPLGEVLDIFRGVMCLGAQQNSIILGCQQWVLFVF